MQTRPVFIPVLSVSIIRKGRCKSQGQTPDFHDSLHVVVSELLFDSMHGKLAGLIFGFLSISTKYIWLSGGPNCPSAPFIKKIKFEYGP